MKYCFIPLLVFILGWQQFSAFAVAHTVKNHLKENHLHLHSEQTAPGTQVASDLPFDSPPIEPEAEVVEEEETKSGNNKYWYQLSEKYSTGEVLFTSSLKSRFLQITSSLQSRSSIPFFILHHSWKSFLS